MRPVRNGHRGGGVLGRGGGGRRGGGRAAGAMLGGLTLANVIGVPLGTLVGEGLGRRGPFWNLAGPAVVAMPLIARQVRPGSEQRRQSVRAEFAEIRQARVWVVFLGSALFEAAPFGAYSFVSPLLTARAGLPEKTVPLVRRSRWWCCSARPRSY